MQLYYFYQYFVIIVINIVCYYQYNISKLTSFELLFEEFRKNAKILASKQQSIEEYQSDTKVTLLVSIIKRLHTKNWITLTLKKNIQPHTCILKWIFVKVSRIFKKHVRRSSCETPIPNRIIPTRIIPTRIILTRITPTRTIPTQESSQPDNSYSDNSHLDNSHPFHFHLNSFHPEKISQVSLTAKNF